MSETMSPENVKAKKVLGHPLNHWLAGFFAVVVIGYLTTPYMMAASLAYFFLVSGLLLRKKDRNNHAKLMMMGMGLDIALVLVLEVLRGAIGTTLEFSMGPLQQAHIYTSTLAVVFYIPTFILGRKRLQNAGANLELKAKHLKLGLTAFTFRTFGFVLMFSLLMKDS